MISLWKFHCVDVTLLMSLYWCQSDDITLLTIRYENEQPLFFLLCLKVCLIQLKIWQKQLEPFSLTPWIVPRVSGHPHSAQESSKMRSLHWRGRETKKFFFLSSFCLCLMGWGSSSLEILQVCSWADPGSSQLGTPVAKRRCRGFLEVYRVLNYQLEASKLVIFRDG